MSNCNDVECEEVRSIMHDQSMETDDLYLK